jgi:hypothetical protein
MPTTVKLKNSVTTTNAPVSLQQGEVAINITDKKVWVGNAATTPVQLLGTGANGSFTNLEYSGTFTGGTGVIAIGAGQFHKDASGNIGMGTNTPKAQIDIFGTGQTTANITDAGARGSMIRLSGDGTSVGTGGAILFSNIQGDTANSVGFAAIKGLLSDGAANTSGSIAFSTRVSAGSTNLSEQMRITSTGNVGIGTSTPRGIIDVLGSGTASTNNWAYIAGGNVGGVNPSANLNIGLAIGQNYSAGNSETNIVWGQGVGAGQYLAIGKWTGSAYSEQMRITSTGNVGIGTSSPTRLLDVRQTYTTDTIVAQIGNINNGNGSTPVATIFDFTENNGTSVSRIASIYTQSIGTTSLTFGTYGSGSLSEKMRIHSSGGVSIGNTTDPSAGSLSVNNNLRFNSGYGSAALAYGCRAWVNFDGTANSNLTGTYTQTGTTVTVTITAHGYTTGQFAFLDFTSGTAVDGSYEVTVIDANEFTVTQASRTTIGNVTDRRCTIRASGNVFSVADNGTGDYTINFITAMPDANYSYQLSGRRSSSANYFISGGGTTAPTTFSLRIETKGTDFSTGVDYDYVNASIFR